ncbi:pol-like protein, partial [Lasius niger]
MQRVAGEKKSNQKSSTGVYGTIAFGKRIAKFIDSFKAAFDLKTIDIPISKVWSYIRAFSNRRQGTSHRTSISEECFHEAFNKLAPLQPEQPLDPDNIKNLFALPSTINNLENDFLLTPFITMEYEEAINTLKTRSAPGSDLISNKIIKKFPAELHMLILKIFNLIRSLSCTDNIVSLITDIRQANLQRKLTGVVFLDLIGAFDNVIPEALLILLTKHGLPHKIMAFIKATTIRRNLIGYAAGITLQRRRTHRGLPQGSILSPILFNLYVSLIHTCLPNTTKILINENIPLSWFSRYLGIHLNPELNWKAHTNQLRNRILPRINILKAISGIRWGAHLSTLLTIYKGYIRPVLDWGCHAFHPLDYPLYLKFSRLQYAALRAVSGMMCTMPTNVLLDINGEQSLTTMMAISNRKLQGPDRINLGTLVDTYLNYSHLYNQIKQFNLPGYLEFNYNNRHFNSSVDTESGFRISNDENNSIDTSFNILHESLNLEATFFTDGSKSCILDTERTGFAIFSPELNLSIQKRINNHASIFEAEALAIVEALDVIVKKNIQRTAIFSDSLSVLTNLENPILSGNTHHLILRIRNSMLRCSQLNLETELIWIPSHKGIIGNERADLLAKKSLHLPDPFLLSKCHYTNLYSKFKELAKDSAIKILCAESLTKALDTLITLNLFYFPH